MKQKNKLLNLMCDASFKTYFERNENVLKSALETYLPLPENRTIKSVQTLNPSIHSPDPKDKKSFFDLKVQLDTRERVNVEMQILSRKSFLKRILFYWARLYSFFRETGGSVRVHSSGLFPGLYGFQFVSGTRGVLPFLFHPFG